MKCLCVTGTVTNCLLMGAVPMNKVCVSRCLTVQVLNWSIYERKKPFVFTLPLTEMP